MTIDEVVTRVKKLSPKDGDTIVVRFDSHASSALIGDVRYVLQRSLPSYMGVTILFLKEGFTIETLDEATMGGHGWIRKPIKKDTKE